MTKAEAVKNYILENFSEADIINAWNDICDETTRPDDMVYENNEEFYDQFGTRDALVRAISYGDFHYIDNYVRFNGYANLETFNHWDEDNSPIDIDEIITFFIENGDYLYEIDSDYLKDCFVEWVCEKSGDTKEEVENLITRYMEDEDIDYLMDEWIKIYDELYGE